MATNPVPSVLKKLAWIAGILLIMALTAHILLPFVANTPALRLRILSQVADQVGGEVDFGALSPALLPLPHIAVSQGRIDRSGKFSIRFAKGDIYPRIWPLLTGRVRIGHLKILEPDIVIPVPTEHLLFRQRSQDRSTGDVSLRVHETLTRVAGVWGPLIVRIHGGRLTLTQAAQPPVTFTGIRIKARLTDQEMALWTKGRSSLMETFELGARVALDSLDSKGRIQFWGLDTTNLSFLKSMLPKAPIPEMQGDLAMHFRTRGLGIFHCEYSVKAPRIVLSNGSRRLAVRHLLLKGEGQGSAKELQLSIDQLRTASPGIQLSGTVTWSAADGFSRVPDDMTLKAFNVDVVPVRASALELAGDQPTVRQLFEILRGGRIPELEVSVSGLGEGAREAGADVRIQGRLSEGQIVLPQDLLHLERVGGQVVIDKGRLTAQDVSARMGKIFAKDGTLVLGLFGGNREFILDTAIDADFSEVPAVLKKFMTGPQAVELIDSMPPVTGRVAGSLHLGDSLDNITVKTSTAGRISVLDASLDVSGDIGSQPVGGPDFKLSFAGFLGPRMVAWLHDRSAMPANLLPMAPITIIRAQIGRNRAEGLAAEGRFLVPGDLNIKAGLKIGPDADLLGTLLLQDADSNAAFEIRKTPKAGVWQAGFSGNLLKSTVDKLLRRNALVLGWLRGELRIRLQDGAPQNNSVRGRLDFSQINTPEGFAIPLSLLSGQVAGNGASFDLSPTMLKWENETARLSGKGTFSDEALRLDLAMETESLDIDKLMQHVNKDGKPPGPRRSGGIAQFPVLGRVRVDAVQAALKGYRFAPLQAVVDLGDGQVSVDLMDAGFCGISIPGQIRFAPGGVWMRLDPRAAESALRDTGQCMAGTSITERLEGTVSCEGYIQGRAQSAEELIQHLEGQLDVKITQGRVYNAGAAGFFTNLLAFISVNQLIEGEIPDLRRNNFQYNSLESKLVFKEGVMRIEEGVLKSNSVNIVASGDYGLDTKEMNLVLLISPLTTVDWIVDHIPLIGNILQGTLVAIPVGVKGPAADPAVVPLSPTAVGSRLGGILKRTLKTPFRILSPLQKKKPSAGNDK